MPLPRPEYPRPQFVRADWLCLNGEWEFESDPGDSGKERQRQERYEQQQARNAGLEVGGYIGAVSLAAVSDGRNGEYPERREDQSREARAVIRRAERGRTGAHEPGRDDGIHRNAAHCGPAGSTDQGSGEELLAQAEKHRVTCVCLFTRIPDFFARMGFSVAAHQDLPDKIHKDCYKCPRLHYCDEVAMSREGCGG